MSKRELNIEDNNYIYYIKEYSSDLEATNNINDYSQIFDKKSSFYITNQNHSNHIEIKSPSLKNILLKGGLEANEHILFCFYKDILPNQKNKKGKSKKEKKIKSPKKLEQIEIGNENENEKEDKISRSSTKEMLIHNDDINLNIDNVDKNENENNSDPDIDLVNNKSNEKFAIKENDYLLCIFNNQVYITNDKLKCFYLSLFFCGISYILYFMDALFDKNKSIMHLFNFFCLPLGILLIYTSIYGFSKINNKIYYDKLCIILTYSSFISPILSFIFSRISSEEIIRKNIFMSCVINFISACFAGFCAYILNELNKKDNKGFLFEQVNII